MDLVSVTHCTRGPSGYEEVHAEYRLNWFDKLLDRSAVEVFVCGPVGWRCMDGTDLSMVQTFVVAAALSHARDEAS